MTRAYTTTHGEPVAWGWDAVGELGINDITRPEWGTPARPGWEKAFDWDDEELVPVLWGCGVTPQGGGHAGETRRHGNWARAGTHDRIGFAGSRRCFL